MAAVATTTSATSALPFGIFTCCPPVLKLPCARVFPTTGGTASRRTGPRAGFLDRKSAVGTVRVALGRSRELAEPVERFERRAREPTRTGGIVQVAPDDPRDDGPRDRQPCNREHDAREAVDG